MDIRILLKLMQNMGQMRQHERWTRSQLEAYQAASLRHLREFTYARSPFYQRFHKGLTDRPLQELPVLTKAMVMENFDELVTDRTVRLENVRAHMASDREGKRFLNRYWVTATSGSTGHPGVFLFNRDEWATVIATMGRAHEWACADDPDTPHEDGVGRLAHFRQPLAHGCASCENLQQPVDERLDANVELRCCPAAGGDWPTA